MVDIAFYISPNRERVLLAAHDDGRVTWAQDMTAEKALVLADELRRALAPEVPQRAGKRRYHSWTPEEDAEITAEYLAGHSPNGIARARGLREPQVQQRLSKLGVVRSPEHSARMSAITRAQWARRKQEAAE